MASNPIMDAVKATPPVTRFYAGITLIVSIGVWVFGFDPHYKLVYEPYYLTKFPPQLWRPITAFFLTGPKLGIIFDTYMLYNYGKELETKKFRQSGDMLYYMAFVGTVIVLLNTFLVRGFVFSSPLGLAMIYTWSQMNRNASVNFYIVPIKAQLMPYAVVALAVLADSPGSGLKLATGLLAAHLYEFLTNIWPRFGGGRNWLATPRWLQFSFEGGPGSHTGSTSGQRAYGTAFDSRARNEPRPVPSSGMFSGGRSTSSSANAGSSAASAWRTRGSGRRLGED